MAQHSCVISINLCYNEMCYKGTALHKYIMANLLVPCQVSNFAISKPLFIVSYFMLYRFILRLAEEENGVIVSNDNFRDIMDERANWKRLVHNRYTYL